MPSHLSANARRVPENPGPDRNRTTALIGGLPGMLFRRRNDAELDMEFVSEACLSLTGYSAEELLHEERLSFNDLILPAYLPEIRKSWKRGPGKTRPGAAGIRDHDRRRAAQMGLGSGQAGAGP